MHLITLFLISMALGVRSISEGEFARGAGVWAGLLVVFHPLVSLPVFGNDVQGVVLIKYQESAESVSEAFRMLTGGAGGPLSSVALQVFFLAEVIQRVIRDKKILLNRRAPRLN
jgi:hypothetical protein